MPVLDWLSDFEWAGGRVRVKKTDVSLAIDRHLVAEIASWALWLPLLGAVALAARLRRPAGPAIWYTPQTPRPWYMLRAAALWAGLRRAASEEEAEAVVYFDDVTVGRPPSGLRGRVINGRCHDVSKSRVAREFEAVFGYPLALDPETAVGPIVEKSEKNGVHDGRIVTGPVAARPGYVYQRLIETADAQGFRRDLRTHCVDGRVVAVWEKVKATGPGFAIHSRLAVLRKPEEVYSAAELELLGRFVSRMGLDWGGLDVLRDRGDGRIYVVDVNKTELGPIIALSRADKIRSLSLLAGALDRMIRGAAADVPAVTSPSAREVVRAR